jgi:hypothetical protein
MVREPAQRCGSEKLEVGDLGRKLLEPALPIGNFAAEQFLIMAVVRFTADVFVASISRRPRPARQNILDPSLEAGLFLLRIAQSALQSSQDGSDSRAVGLSIAIGRARFELPIVPAASEEIVRAGPQKQLKHRFVSHASRRKRGTGGQRTSIHPKLRVYARHAISVKIP